MRFVALDLDDPSFFLVATQKTKPVPLVLCILWFQAVHAFLSHRRTSRPLVCTAVKKAWVQGWTTGAIPENEAVALERVGLEPSDSVDAIRYRWNPAVGMLQLLSTASDAASAAPRWIPVIQQEENVLVANGWSFLDLDDSEPLSAFDVDAANQEGLYRPKWGSSATENDTKSKSILKLSALGFDLTMLSSEMIQRDAVKLQKELCRRVLLQGATDPRGLKCTHNGFSFSGSVTDFAEGIFVCAIGGLPLFATTDLMPTTATAGWLSFARPISADHICLIQPEANDDDQRIEVLCARTKCHLGHFFGAGEGYCINASCLDFVSKHGGQRFPGPVSYRSLEQATNTPSTRLLSQVLQQTVKPKYIVLGAGCFWHVEFALRRLPGVIETRTGYAGGDWNRKPTYEAVSEGHTGHAEVVLLIVDTKVLNPRILFDCFLAMHDPTKVRAHGKHASRTGQYRSCILLPKTSDVEHAARKAMQDCQAQLGKVLSTELCIMDDDLGWFHEAEERHQRHDERNVESNNNHEISTVSPEAWLSIYGRRATSVVGSAQTLDRSVTE